MGNELDLKINQNHDKLNKIDMHILSFVKNNIELCKTLNLCYKIKRKHTEIHKSSHKE